MSRAFSLMERAPWYIVYLFHWPYCAYLTVRYGGALLPTVANPGLDASGLCNESKTDLFNLLGPIGKRHFAPFVTITTGPSMLAEAKRLTKEQDLSFPVVAKPDIGRRGFGVKTAHTTAELATHLSKFPRGIRMVIQRYAEGPGEVGVYYVRMPSAPRGRIVSLTIKHFPEVVGDGSATLKELILLDARAPVSGDLYLRRNRANLTRVIPAGERYQLISVGNHVKGAVFENGSSYITEALERVFDTIAQEIPGFYIGRFDVRYTTLEELQRGQGFMIVEYNGAGGEPTHMWHPDAGIWEVYRESLAHWKYLYAIGAENRARGARPMSFFGLAKRYFADVHLLETYPDEE